MTKEREKADYILMSDIEHWLMLIENNQYNALNRIERNFDDFNIKRTEIKEQIFNYIKKREAENDLQKM